MCARADNWHLFLLELSLQGAGDGEGGVGAGALHVQGRPHHMCAPLPTNTALTQLPQGQTKQADLLASPSHCLSHTHLSASPPTLTSSTCITASRSSLSARLSPLLPLCALARFLSPLHSIRTRSFTIHLNLVTDLNICFVCTLQTRSRARRSSSCRRTRSGACGRMCSCVHTHGGMMGG